MKNNLSTKIQTEKENKNKFGGLGIALITPFDEKGKLDTNSLIRLIKHIVKGGADFIVINGSTGESPTTTLEEQKKVLEIARETSLNKLPIIFGLGGNNTAEVVSKIKKFDHNVDAFMSVVPYYNKPTQQGIIHHFQSIADTANSPLIIYNVPSRTSSNIEAETTIELSNHENIIGIKEASTDIAQWLKIKKDCPSEFSLICGNDVTLVPMMASGAIGIISVLANAFTSHFKKTVSYCLANEYRKALETFLDTLSMDPIMYKEGNPVGIKQLLSHMWICKNYVRSPLQNATESLAKEIADVFKKIYEE